MSECAERLSRCGYHCLAVAFGRERVARPAQTTNVPLVRHAAVDDGPLAAARRARVDHADQAGTAVAVAKQIADVAVVGQVGVGRVEAVVGEGDEDPVRTRCWPLRAGFDHIAGGAAGRERPGQHAAVGEIGRG